MPSPAYFFETREGAEEFQYRMEKEGYSTRSKYVEDGIEVTVRASRKKTTGYQRLHQLHARKKKGLSKGGFWRGL